MEKEIYIAVRHRLSSAKASLSSSESQKEDLVNRLIIVHHSIKETKARIVALEKFLEEHSHVHNFDRVLFPSNKLACTICDEIEPD